LLTYNDNSNSELIYHSYFVKYLKLDFRIISVKIYHSDHAVLKYTVIKCRVFQTGGRKPINTRLLNTQ